MTLYKHINRRSLLASSAGVLGILSLGPSFLAMASSRPFVTYQNLKNLGPLGRANSLGMRLPEGFAGRLIAASGQKVWLRNGAESSYTWHTYPDGGACFATDDGGWIYVSNSEITLSRGGVGALRFDKHGQVIDAYSILRRTSKNCAGGPTPWGTWLSCEEISSGKVYECDPYGQMPAKVREGLGTFKHEAAAIDPVHSVVYLTEDQVDGCFYRYIPGSAPVGGRIDLDKGVLEVAVVQQNAYVIWERVPNPNPGFFNTATRKQVRSASKFNGGEGIWYHDGLVYFTTKGDDRIWSYDTREQTLGIIYDKSTTPSPILSGVDNIVVSDDGHILVAEDGGSMQIVVIGPYGDMYPLVQLVDQDHSEITGPAINHLNNRLYFSSQRGPTRFSRGMTYELMGQFA